MQSYYYNLIPFTFFFFWVDFWPESWPLFFLEEMSIGLWQQRSSGRLEAGCHVQTTMEASFLRFLQSFDFESNFNLDTAFKRVKSILMLKSWNVGFMKETWNEYIFCKYFTCMKTLRVGFWFVSRKQKSSE